jgi:hypothetical protein
LIIVIILGDEYVTKLLIMQFSPTSKDIISNSQGNLGQHAVATVWKLYKIVIYGSVVTSGS